MATGKLDTEPFKNLLTSDILRLESVFRSNGYSFRLVGGVVRDLLLGRSPKDVDIATECTPDAMMKLFEAHGIRYIATGLQHGTLTAHINHKDYEVTTLRIDRVTDGRHAVVEFTTDWREDAQRRDLTINAMSLELDGTLYDYFDGQKHLAEKRVVFVGDARTRIREDFLRILRYFRFYGRIAPVPDQHDPATLEAIRETCKGLENISVERVWTEMGRILVGNHAPNLVRTMYSLDVAKYIGRSVLIPSPEPHLMPDSHCFAGLPKDGNVEELEKVWKSMRHKSLLLQPVSLLMALVHTEEEAYDLSHRWKLSNNEKRLGVFIVGHRRQAYDPDMPFKVCQDFLVDGVPRRTVVELLHYCSRDNLATELQEWRVPKFPLNGKDLQTIGFKPGPLLGRVLRHLQDKWKESYFTLDRDDLMERAEKERERHQTTDRELTEEATKRVSKLMLRHKIESETQMLH